MTRCRINLFPLLGLLSLAFFVAYTTVSGYAKEDVKARVNKELAEKGEKLFAEKGCAACHTIGKGKLVGPDL
ncbi:MAG: c-type cytochrome, partial [Candidatus Methanosuratincola sp.]